MDFPWTRHFQRYEYIAAMGYNYRKVVVDVGCGPIPFGAAFLSRQSKMVYAVDPRVDVDIMQRFSKGTNLICIAEDVFDFIGKVDVAVAVEVFEHMPDPQRFVGHLARGCEYAFLTTPLACFTHNVRNPVHVAEYSAQDFDGIVGKEFEIEDKVYQTGDMQILPHAEPNGDSFCHSHVVQMVWARSKHARK